MNMWKVSTVGLVIAMGVMVGAQGIPSAHAEPQPEMQKAIEDLSSAIHRLQAANPDKDGHRVKAIQAANLAIEETRAGMRWDDEHHR